MNEITEQDKQKIVVETKNLVTQAETLIIKTEQENSQAAMLTAVFKQEIKRRKEILAPTKASLDASKAAYNGLVTLMLDPLTDAVEIITSKIGGFVKAENHRRAELQAKEDARVAELQAKEDARVANLKAKAEAKGKPIPDIAPKIIPQRVVSAVSAPAGTSYINYWSGQCVDIKALCEAVVAGTVASEYVQVNQVALNNYAKLKKREGPILAGCIGLKEVRTTQRLKENGQG